MQERPRSDIVGLGSGIVRDSYCHPIQVSSQVSVEAVCWTKDGLVSSKEALLSNEIRNP
jgi:hypothetical protein